MPIMISQGIEYREDTGELIVNGEKLIPNVRKFSKLKVVLKHPEKLGEKEDKAAYFMYRDLPPLRGKWARFDITIIPPWRIGDELAKTKGHYHLPPSPGRPSYPEVYQVLMGRAIYLLQRHGSDFSVIVDFIEVEAHQGDVVVIPPEYGHVTVNPGDETLIMSNIIYREVKSYYGPYEKMRGAAYYYTTAGFERNALYSQVPEIRHEKPSWRTRSIAEDFLMNESSFSWLKNVEEACKEGFYGFRCL